MVADEVAVTSRPESLLISAFALAMSSGLSAYAPLNDHETMVSPCAIGRGFVAGLFCALTATVVTLASVVVALLFCSAAGRVGERTERGKKNCVIPATITTRTPPII